MSTSPNPADPLPVTHPQQASAPVELNIALHKTLVSQRLVRASSRASAQAALERLQKVQS